ncbi:MAG: glycosyltransferase family 4 protein [Balneolaceae bacterium]
MNILIINAHVEDKLGGSEIQCDLIARKLTEFGHEVLYLAVNGRLSPGYNTSYHVAPVSLKKPEELEQAIKKSSPDVIYWRYNKKAFISSMKAINKFQVPVIFSVSHKYDIQKYRTDLLPPEVSAKETVKNWRDFCQNRRQFNGFRYVDAVSNQCRDFMGKTGVKREIYFPNSMVYDSVPFQWNKKYCVWASSIKKRKHPEKLIALAEELQNKDVDFLMVGEIQDSAYSYVKQPESLPPNLHYLGVQSYSEVNGLIDGAQFLIHTCEPEGFPNNFIQAWSYGKPVVSLYYDPDGLIEKKQLGYVSITPDQFKSNVQRLLDEPELCRVMGMNARALAEDLFDGEKNVKKLESLMVEITENKASKGNISSTAE